MIYRKLEFIIADAVEYNIGEDMFVARDALRSAGFDVKHSRSSHSEDPYLPYKSIDEHFQGTTEIYDI